MSIIRLSDETNLADSSDIEFIERYDSSSKDVTSLVELSVTL